MSKSKTLKEIALELLEKYRKSEETCIYEFSGFIKADLASLETECDEIRKQIEGFAEPKWTPVSERLPDTYNTVLLSDGKYVWIDSGNYVVWRGSFDFADSVGFDKMAWMPLPKPYQQEDESK